jgi:4a-hydroxytetrahydrobiopterin dehydratase
MRPLLLLTQEQIEERLKQLDPSWRQEDKYIVREFSFPAFMEGIQFLNRVAEIAEELNHHPDINISYKDIKLSISTHYKGGLTVRDFRLAGRIDALWQEAYGSPTAG